MGVNATNRIINPAMMIRKQILDYEAKKWGKHKRSEKWKTMNLRKITLCSQCQRGMRKDIALQQLDNKRENAPICIPCILGKPRKNL